LNIATHHPADLYHLYGVFYSARQLRIDFCNRRQQFRTSQPRPQRRKPIRPSLHTFQTHELSCRSPHRLPHDDDLVFLDNGKCIAEVVNVKTRAVLRTLRTTVVDDEVSELKVGNEIAILTPLCFVAGTFDFKPESLSRLGRLKNRILFFELVHAKHVARVDHSSSSASRRFFLSQTKCLQNIVSVLHSPDATY
jgi:hypothetical protein